MMDLPSCGRSSRKRGSRIAFLISLLGIALSPWTNGWAAEAVPRLDSSFAGNGISEVPLAEWATSLVVLGDGQIVASSGRVIARFGVNGESPSVCAVPLEDGARAGGSALQRDGKLLVSVWVEQPSYAASLRRFHVDCSRDEHFGSGGIVASKDAWRIAVQGDGEILLAHSEGYISGGPTLSGVDGVTKDGVPTFSLSGLSGDIGALLPWRERRFTVIFNHRQFRPGEVPGFSVRRLTPEGLDRSFLDTFNTSPFSFATDAVVGPDGAVFTAGGTQVVRFAATGVRDTNFGTGGVLELGAAVDRMAVQPDGAIVAVLKRADGGRSLLRFSHEGRLDEAFSSWGDTVFPVGYAQRPLAFSAEAKLMLGGSHDGNFSVSRVHVGHAEAVEFYHSVLDHYFMSSNALEIANLDLGVHRGWARTGRSFSVYGSADVAAPEARPVCRFYIPPERGDSHFYPASPEECAEVIGKVHTDPNYRGYVLETPSAFYVPLPDRQTGGCRAGTMPVYRLWNQRLDSNHAYTTSRTVRQSLIARGYLPEGYGPDGTVMCALR